MRLEESLNSLNVSDFSQHQATIVSLAFDGRYFMRLNNNESIASVAQKIASVIPIKGYTRTADPTNGQMRDVPSSDFFKMRLIKPRNVILELDRAKSLNDYGINQGQSLTIIVSFTY